MGPVYHTGELEVQRRAGVAEAARRTGGVLRSAIPPVAQEFLRGQRMVVASSVDAQGQPWASVLAGEPGFIEVSDERTLRVGAEPFIGDPLAGNLREGGPLGLLAIEFATRRRAKLKGRATRGGDGSFLLDVERVYALCPNYIQAREVIAIAQATPPSTTLRQGDSLTRDQERWVSGADTFFIATFHPETGADASHRGGLPGFVSVKSPSLLEFPDYAGNKMFNTLGNILANPAAGLLYIDFERGSTLQLAGRASTIWDPARAREFPGAERVVAFQVESVIEASAILPMSWRFLEYSPANPR